MSFVRIEIQTRQHSFTRYSFKAQRSPDVHWGGQNVKQWLVSLLSWALGCHVTSALSVCCVIWKALTGSQEGELPTGSLKWEGSLLFNISFLQVPTPLYLMRQASLRKKLFLIRYVSPRNRSGASTDDYSKSVKVPSTLQLICKLTYFIEYFY